jgi:hypothetical protein
MSGGDTHPRISADPSVQAHYERLRDGGMGHGLAEILATRTFPALWTDTEFNRGRCNGNQFEKTPGLGDYYRKAAEAAGVSTTGKHYCTGLADYPGDPTAWVSDRGDVLRVAREKGYKVSGSVDYTPPDRGCDPGPDVAVADDLIDAEVSDILEANPGASRDEVRDRVFQLRSGAVDAAESAIATGA